MHYGDTIEKTMGTLGNHVTYRDVSKGDGVTFGFNQAIQAIADGKKVANLNWRNGTFLSQDIAIVRSYECGGMDYNPTFNSAEIMSKEWIVVE